jgi:lipopolysaccharide biosynthesis glycosyltransferase
MAERRWPGIHLGFEKFQMYDTVSRYDRTLFVDGDVIIAPTAPDIFDIAPMGQLAFMNEYDHFVKNQENLRGVITDLRKRSNRGVTGKALAWTYFNSGVFLIEPRFAWIVKDRPPSNLTNKFLTDQRYINIRIYEQDLPVFRLPIAYNYMTFHLGGDLTKACAGAYFIHASYPAHEWRMKAMKEMAERLTVLK